ncbi:hypothetical protein LWU32_03610 [Enterobacter hormaechei]|nr:hypothetical protein [Enterobacter hormaechei]
MTNTTFNTNGNDFLEYIGSPTGTGQGVHSGMKLSNFAIYGKGNAGVGLRLSNTAYLTVESVYTVRNNVGINATGILSSTFEKINSQLNNYGMYLNNGTNATANALNINGIFSGNLKYGIEGEVGTRVSLTGSNFEGNGTQGDAGTGGVYLRAKEPMSVISLNDCYFEANMGVADLNVSNLTTSPLIVNVNSCTFVRGNSSGGYCTYVIRCQSPGGGQIILNLNGCHFFTQTAFGYTPDPSRPFITGGAFLKVIGMETCHFSETTSLSSAILNSGGVISGSISATGVGISLPGYMTVTKPSTGIYEIHGNFDFGATGDSYQVVATNKTAGGRVLYAQKIDNNDIRVATVDQTGNPVDSAFDFMISKSR